MTEPLVTNAQLGEALARAVTRLSERPVDRGERARWCAGEVPDFEMLAAWIGVNVNDLLEVFNQEAGYRFKTGRLQ